MFPLLVATTLSATPLLASAASTSPSIPTPWSACFSQAGRYYQLPPTLLLAIARTESHLNPAAVNVNRNGSRDVGLMQINSRWFPALQAIGIRPERLYEPCVSIWVGAWLLANAVATHGYGWDAIGAYNAGDRQTAAAAQRRAAYALRVSRNLPVLPAPVGLLDAVDSGRSHIAEFVVTAPVADNAVGNQLHTR
jgi:soluble lytic murein transglycosylase-like protein